MAILYLYRFVSFDIEKGKKSSASNAFSCSDLVISSWYVFITWYRHLARFGFGCDRQYLIAIYYCCQLIKARFSSSVRNTFLFLSVSLYLFVCAIIHTGNFEKLHSISMEYIHNITNGSTLNDNVRGKRKAAQNKRWKKKTEINRKKNTTLHHRQNEMKAKNKICSEKHQTNSIM